MMYMFIKFISENEAIVCPLQGFSLIILCLYFQISYILLCSFVEALSSFHHLVF
jgi:hypothetical protein